MKKDERIILFLGVAALAALVIAKWPDFVMDEAKADQNAGGLELTSMTYNQPPPSVDMPPMANVLPNAAASMLGSSAGTYWQDPYECGCY